MAIRQTELSAKELGGETLKSEWAQAEIEPELHAYEKAIGICQNLMLYARGEKDTFRAYFVKDVYEQAAIERHMRRALKIQSNLPTSETPQKVMEIDGVSLYRWSSYLNGDEFDIFYEACRGDEVPLYFQQSQTSATVTAEA